MLWIMYFFNFLDRNALVNAKLNSLEKDLGLKGTQYNTLISILFVGYIAGQIPSNMILNRVRPSWYLGSFCMAWSIVCLLTFKANDFGGMLACRFLLGVTEAPVSTDDCRSKEGVLIRSIVLPWCSLPSFALLHQEGDSNPHGYLLYW